MEFGAWIPFSCSVPANRFNLKRDLGLNIFRIKIAEDHFIGAQTTKGLLSYIQRQRCPSSSTTTDSPLSVFLNVLTLLSSLSTSTYHDLFLDVFLTSSKTFYASQAESMLLQHTQGFCSIGTYLQHVQSRLNEEAHRAELIHSSVGGDAAALKSQMLRIVESQLVAKQTHRILLRLDDVIEDLEDAERLYALLSRVSEVPALQKSLRNLIEVSPF